MPGWTKLVTWKRRQYGDGTNILKFGIRVLWAFIEFIIVFIQNCSAKLVHRLQVGSIEDDV